MTEPHGGGVITPRLGSLFTGAAGLDLAVETVLGTQTAWMCETDPAAARVLAHRFPGVPNLGDVTAVDWTQVEPVDVICGGSPCQDVSHAGKRAGMHEGTRSNLWVAMCEAVAQLRPRLVIWENVRGAYSACADSDMGRCPRCVGEDPTAGHAPLLRALGRVVGDLADIGYDARWCGLRAADVGAPHGRFRVFIVASDASLVEGGVGHGDAVRAGWRAVGRGPSAGPGAATDANDRTGYGQRPCTESRPGGAVASDAANVGHERGWRTRAGGHGSADSGRPTPDASRDGRDEGWPEPARIIGGSDAAQRSATTPDAEGAERRGPESEHLAARPIGTAEPRERAGTDWGQYGPAIRRWEQRLGRIAPAPTEPGVKGGRRLSPAFVEWLMGWPDGWVTDVPGVTRNDALRICGNGVVPQQAAAALLSLLVLEESAA